MQPQGISFQSDYPAAIQHGSGQGIRFDLLGYLFDFSGASLPSRTSLTRASTGWRFNSSGVLVPESTDVARFDYDPSTLALRGLLVEGQRTNLFLRSAELDDANWTKTGLTISADAATALDGATAADKVIPTAVSAQHFVTQSCSFTSGLAYTLSWIVKASGYNWIRLSFPSATFAAAGRAASFNLSTGALGAVDSGVTQKIVNLGNGWYRCSITATANATASGAAGLTVNNADSTGVITFTGDGTSGVLAWSAQLEQGALHTSPIPTAGSTVTRAADVLSLAVPSGTYDVDVYGGTVLTAGTKYTSTGVVVSGGAWTFAWPAAAVTAGERHVKRIDMRRTA